MYWFINNFVEKGVLLNMNVIPGGAQHIGAREDQQDSFGFSDFENEDFVKKSGVMAVLADGMGGMSNGAEAGSTAVRVMLQQYMSRDSAEGISETLEKALLASNEAVIDVAKNAGMEWGVGTTLISTVIFNGELHWISAGDSRIYLYRMGHLMQLTVDHIYAQELYNEVALGNISKAEADNNPDKNKLTSYVGYQGLSLFDRNDIPFLLKPGDKVVLLSDGIFGTLSEKELVEELESHPQEAAEAIVTKTVLKNQPFQDNMTIVILGYN